MTPDRAIPRTLETVRVGERVTLQAFPFETLRALCADNGLSAGSSVRCLVAGPAVLLLERDDGHQVRMDMAWARLIHVEPTASIGSVK